MLAFESADDVRDTGGVHHQALADHPQRQGAAAAEGQQHQGLVAREGQLIRSQERVEFAEQNLLGTHDRGDRGHRRRRAEPGLPDPGGPVYRIKRQLKRLTHGPNR